MTSFIKKIKPNWHDMWHTAGGHQAHVRRVQHVGGRGVAERSMGAALRWRRGGPRGRVGERAVRRWRRVGPEAEQGRSEGRGGREAAAEGRPRVCGGEWVAGQRQAELWRVGREAAAESGQ